MSYSELDFWLDAAHDGAQSIADHAVQEFKIERLKAYYLKHPNVGKSAVEMLAIAKGLQQSSKYVPALVFSASAVEMTLRDLLLKPIINGLVHDEAVADIVMAMTPNETGHERFSRLFFPVFEKVAGRDIRTWKRPSVNVDLWTESQEIQGARNKLLHYGVLPLQPVIEKAVPVAEYFLENVLQEVMRGLGLLLDANHIVTGHLIPYAHSAPPDEVSFAEEVSE